MTSVQAWHAYLHGRHEGISVTSMDMRADSLPSATSPGKRKSPCLQSSSTPPPLRLLRSPCSQHGRGVTCCCSAHLSFDPLTPGEPHDISQPNPHFTADAPPLDRTRRRRRCPGCARPRSGRLQHDPASGGNAGLGAQRRARPAPLHAGPRLAGAQPTQPPALARRPATRRRNLPGAGCAAPASRDRSVRAPDLGRLRRLHRIGSDRGGRARLGRRGAALPRRRATHG